jgi:hypothetical protein
MHLEEDKNNDQYIESPKRPAAAEKGGFKQLTLPTGGYL